MWALSAGRELLEGLRISPRALAAQGASLATDGARRNGMEWLSVPDITFDHLLAEAAELEGIAPDIRAQLSRDALYLHYLDRQDRDAEALQRDEAHEIPQDFDYGALSSLSGELKQKLTRARPANIAQAARIEGITPAALVLILSRLKQDARAEGRRRA
jgi:tRNA uridine 5-carboxymethylaminomethyl modification enzyme